VKGADNLDTSRNVRGGFELTKAFVAGRNDLGQVLVQTKAGNFLLECVDIGKGDGSSKALDEGRILLQRRVL